MNRKLYALYAVIVLFALAAHAKSRVVGGRSWYTAPVKALVNEKFFELCQQLGPENVGMMTGDSSFNEDALVMCCTTEILAFMALREGALTDADIVILDEFHFYADARLEPMPPWPRQDWAATGQEIGASGIGEAVEERSPRLLGAPTAHQRGSQETQDRR